MTEAGPTDTRGDLAHRLIGSAHLRRVGRWRFPTHELSQDNVVLAALGRGGWVRTYLGSGQQIALSDGARWRLGSFGFGGGVGLAVRDERRQNVAVARLSNGAIYGINGKEYSFTLTPNDTPRFGRSNSWILRQFEEELAVITRYPLSVEATSPVHLGAVFVAFSLVRLGLPDESKPRIPEFQWG